MVDMGTRQWSLNLMRMSVIGHLVPKISLHFLNSSIIYDHRKKITKLTSWIILQLFSWTVFSIVTIRRNHALIWLQLLNSLFRLYSHYFKFHLLFSSIELILQFRVSFPMILSSKSNDTWLLNWVHEKNNFFLCKANKNILKNTYKFIIIIR